MTKLIQTSFNTGELSPRCYGRVDLEKYHASLDTALNALAQPHGPVSRRPGFKYIATVKDSADETILIPFEFSTTQAYILEFGDLYFRVYKDGGQIVSGTPVEVVTPYAKSDLAQLKYCQSADTMYLVHPDYAPRKLTRTSHTAWTITEITFAWPPFLAENATDVTVDASAVTGNGITLTASAAIFDTTNHVGAYWCFFENVEAKHPKWRADTAVNSGDLCYYDGKVFSAGSTDTTGNDPPVHDAGAESDGVVTWTYLHGGKGYVKLVDHASNTTSLFYANVISRLPDSALSSPKTWREGAWSLEQGYPSAVTFFEERVAYAGAANNPNTVWLTKSGSFEDFNYGESLDDEGIMYNLTSDQMNNIRWLKPSRKLLIGTAAEEWWLSGSGDGALTPTDVLARKNTSIGSQNFMPVALGNAIIFVERIGKRVRRLGYDYSSDAYDGEDLLVLAEHLTKNYGFSYLAYQQTPFSVVWAIRSDGALCSLTYLPTHEVTGWTRHTTPADGEFESVATIPGTTRDEVWVVVKRTINGSDVRYVEQLQGEDWSYTFEQSETTVGDLSEVSNSPLVDGDDGYTSGYLSSFSSSGDIYIGKSYSYSCDAFLRFPAVMVPQGATIQNAFVTMRCTTTGGNAGDAFVVTLNDVDNAVAPTSRSEMLALDKTAGIAWSPGLWSTGSYYDTPSLKTIIQSIVNRAGWASGNAMQVLIDDNASPGQKGISNTTKAVLHIQYGDGDITTVSSTASIADDAFYVDSGLTYESTATDITGATQADPISITAVDHGLTTGNSAYIEGVSGMTELNGRTFTVTRIDDDTFTLDDESGVFYSTYTSGGTVQKKVTVISGLDHLENETVQILADGKVQDSKAVGSGSITLDTACVVAQIGLGYNTDVKTLRPDAGPQAETWQGETKRVSKVTLRLYETIHAKVGPDADNLDAIEFEDSDLPKGSMPELFTGDKFINPEAGYSTAGQILIRQDKPTPMTIMAIVQDIDE